MYTVFFYDENGEESPISYGYDNRNDALELAVNAVRVEESAFSATVVHEDGTVQVINQNREPSWQNMH